MGSLLFQRQLSKAIALDDEEGMLALINLADPRAPRQLLLSACALNMPNIARVVLQHIDVDDHALQTLCVHGRHTWLPLVSPKPPHPIWGSALETAARHNQVKVCQWIVERAPIPAHIDNAFQWALLFEHEAPADLLAPLANVAPVLDRIQAFDPPVLHQLCGSDDLPLVRQWRARLDAIASHAQLRQSIETPNVDAVLSKM